MSIDYTIKAIPTLYAGRRYRSRLEARWAAFFDLLGWKHEYEPGDLAGWSPDFLIRTAADPILVEVKPITSIDDDVCFKMAKSGRAAAFSGSLLLVGTAPFEAAEIATGASIGWIGSITHPFPFGDFPIADWFEAKVCEALGAIDIEGGTPVAEIAGVWDQNLPRAPRAAINSIWSSATNAVQWRGRDA